MKNKCISFVIIFLLLFAITMSLGFEESSATTTIKISDYIILGKYNGQQILWRCVDINENGPLMLSDRVITFKIFDASGNHKYLDGTPQANTTYEDSRRTYFGSNLWETSNARSWLNSSASAGNVVWLDGCPPEDYANEKGFLADGNFSTEERKLIKSVTQKSLLNELDVNKLKIGGTEILLTHSYEDIIHLGNYDRAFYHNVTDKVFLLDIKQLRQVYDNAKTLGANYYRAKPTRIALDIMGWDPNKESEFTGNFLRTPYGPEDQTGNGAISVYYEEFDEELQTDLCYMVEVRSIAGFRPAFYLDISKSEFSTGTGSATSPYKLKLSTSGSVSPSPTSGTLKPTTSAPSPTSAISEPTSAMPSPTPPITGHAHQYIDGTCSCGDKLYWTILSLQNTYKVTKSPSAPIWSMPITSNGSVLVRRVDQDRELVITEYVENKAGSIWYKIGSNEYIYSGNVKIVPVKNNPVLVNTTFSGWDIADIIPYGIPYTIGGIITSSLTIDNVNVKVIDAEGKTELDVNAAAGVKIYDMKNIDRNVKMRTLTDGPKTFEIWISNTAGSQKIYSKAFTVNRPKFAIPFALDGFRITSVWGYRPGYDSLHKGIDMVNVNDSTVRASADGIVVLKKFYLGYGNAVFIEHEIDWQLWQTRYAHLDSFADNVVLYQPIYQGNPVGIMGNTGHSHGIHLHFEIGKALKKGSTADVNVIRVDPESMAKDLIPFANIYRNGGIDRWRYYLESGGTTPKPIGIVTQKYEPTKAASTLSVTGYTYPTEIFAGQLFDIKGNVSSNYIITSLTAGIYSGTQAKYIKTVTPNAINYNLSGVDSAMQFSKLAAGNYLYTVTAKDASGVEKTLISKNFSVIPNPPTPTLGPSGFTPIVPQVYETIKDSVPVWSKPDSNSTKVKTIVSTGTVIVVQATTVNEHNNLWLKTHDGYWIYGDNLKLSTLTNINHGSVFLKQKDNGTCTLVASVMMLRRKAILNKDTGWNSITEASVKPVAWGPNGLKFNFTYKGMPVTMIKFRAVVNKKAELIKYLSQKPEGIVIYAHNDDDKNRTVIKRHAVLLTDYDPITDTFYIADPDAKKDTPIGRAKLENATTLGTGQDGKIAEIDQLWICATP
ncbi:MAG: peptidoglycan DD-metalloendopeptidase family protein [Saccharofermentanales bacterium]